MHGVCALVLTSGLLTGCGHSDNDPIVIEQPATNRGLPGGPATLAQVELGRYLVTTGGCADCHNRGVNDPRDPNWLAGYINDPEVNPGNQGVFSIGPNTIYARNLTPDRATGLGDWSIVDVFNALRLGHDKDGKFLAPPMPWGEFQNLTDEDTWAIVAYLKSIKAVHNPVPENDNGQGGPVDTAQFYPTLPPKVPAYPAANEVEVTNTTGPGLPLGDATRDQVLRGRYLATAANDCNACHSVGGNNPNDPRYMAGYVADPTVNPTNTGQFQIGPVTVFARNLTPDMATGLGGFSNQQIFAALHDGVDPHDPTQQLKPPMPWPTYHAYSAEDTWALIAYLRNIKAVSNDVPDDVVPPGFPGFTRQAEEIPPYPVGNEIP
jgi:mono/diheme cytochrome c family protein